MKKFVVILCTTPHGEETEKIAKALVEEKLAACVNVIAPLKSFFRWEGKIEEEKEDLLIIKTVKEKIDLIIQRIKELHSYEIPEIIALPISAGDDVYLKWLREAI